MAYSQNTKSLILGLVEKGRTPEATSRLLGEIIAKGEASAKAFLKEQADFLEMSLDPAVYLDLKASVPAAKTIRQWLPESNSENRYESAWKIPNLKLGVPKTGIIDDGSRVAHYAIVDVLNDSSVEVLNCSAWVYIFERNLHLPLHFAGTPITASEAEAPRVIINPLKPARLDIAFAPLSAKDKLKHSNITLTSGDVVRFPPVEQLKKGDMQGCWIAQPLALYNPQPGLEAFLKPGDYRLRVQVNCANGEGAKAEYTLMSPKWGDALKIVQA